VQFVHFLFSWSAILSVSGPIVQWLGGPQLCLDPGYPARFFFMAFRSPLQAFSKIFLYPSPSQSVVYNLYNVRYLQRHYLFPFFLALFLFPCVHLLFSFHFHCIPCSNFSLVLTFFPVGFQQVLPSGLCVSLRHCLPVSSHPPSAMSFRFTTA